MTSEGPDAPLSYADPDTFPRRQIPARRIIVAAVSVTVALAAWRFGPGILSELRFLRLQRQWSSFSMPADQVVFDTTSVAPPVTNRFTREITAEMTGFTSACRRTFPAGCIGSATVFLHERTSPAGHRRIVSLDAFGFDIVAANHASRVVSLWDGVYHPSSNPQTAGTGGLRQWFIACEPTDRLRLFGGQPDASDPSRFTIRYDFNGVPGIISVYLQDDDTLRLAPDRGSGDGYDPWKPWSLAGPARKG